MWGLYWGYIGIMEKNMETVAPIRLYGNNGKEHGNYYLGFRVYNHVKL